MWAYPMDRGRHVIRVMVLKDHSGLIRKSWDGVSWCGKSELEDSVQWSRGDVDLDLDIALAVGTRQTYSACVCRPELKAQGGYTLKSSGSLTCSVIHTQHKDVQRQHIFSFQKQLSISSSAHANCGNGGDAKAHIPHPSETHDSSPPYFKETKDVSRAPLEKQPFNRMWLGCFHGNSSFFTLWYFQKMAISFGLLMLLPFVVCIHTHTEVVWVKKKNNVK